MPTITICSSVAFYRQAIDIQTTLEKQGFTVQLPETAEKMKQSGDFDVSRQKTWFTNADDYHEKSRLMRAHFEKIEQGDAILVVNYQKNGVDNYIGGNVLMEMALAFYLRQPIFILNEVPETSSFLEEILGFQPVVLHGVLDNFSGAYQQAASR